MLVGLQPHRHISCPDLHRPQLLSSRARRRGLSGEQPLRCQPVHQLSSSPESAASPPAADGTARPGSLDTNRIQLDLPRRRLEVTFTCNKCGTSFVCTEHSKCQQCEVWHKIQDAAGLIEEVSGPGTRQADTPLEIQLPKDS